MTAFNKGEWSELYAICYILHNRKMQVANDELMPTDQYVKVLKIFMKSIFGDSAYNVKSKEIFLIGSELPVSNFQIEAQDVQSLLNDIKSSSGRSFSLDSGERIMNSLQAESFKANSYEKADINTLSIMPQEEIPRNVGFSVKSQIGGLSTLLNASKATNFVYQVVDFNGSDNDINSINDNRGKVKKRIEAIKRNGGKFIFHGIDCDSFKQNLRLIDSQYPKVLAEMLLCYFSSSRISSMEEIIRNTSLVDDVDMSEAEIRQKTKEFLNKIALGMIPTRVWDGSSLGGGCIFVKDDGDVLCYTLYDEDHFNDYLLKNTKFDTASTGRHEFGKLFTAEDGKKYFKLNLDIRFTQ